MWPVTDVRWVLGQEEKSRVGQREGPKKYELWGGKKNFISLFDSMVGWKVGAGQANFSMTLDKNLLQCPCSERCRVDVGRINWYAAGWTITSQKSWQQIHFTFEGGLPDLPQDSVFSLTQYRMVINDILKKSASEKYGRNSLYTAMLESGSKNILKD